MPDFSSYVELWLALLVAMSPLTAFPIFLSMTDGLQPQEAQKLGRSAVLTAGIIAVAIVFLGQAIFRVLNITIDDLRVAGGVVLLLIALNDLLFSQQKRKLRDAGENIGVVPLGTPIILGPAAMTACVVLADSHGRLPVLAAAAVNLLLVGLMLHFSDKLKSLLKPAVTRAFGKVMSLFLAAIAVSMLRTGIQGFVAGWGQ